MEAGEGHTHHNVGIGFNKVVKCFHHLISAFGPFEVCVTFFVWLLRKKHTEYNPKYNGQHLFLIRQDESIFGAYLESFNTET